MSKGNFFLGLTVFVFCLVMSWIFVTTLPDKDQLPENADEFFTSTFNTLKQVRSKKMGVLEASFVLKDIHESYLDSQKHSMDDIFVKLQNTELELKTIKDSFFSYKDQLGETDLFHTTPITLRVFPGTVGTSISGFQSAAVGEDLLPWLNKLIFVKDRGLFYVTSVSGEGSVVLIQGEPEEVETTAVLLGKTLLFSSESNFREFQQQWFVNEGESE